MTFYEQELRKIVGERYPDAIYVGRACYVRLSDMNRAKIQFVTGIVSNQYNALQMTILNRGEGQVDTLRLRFSDLLGTKATSNLNFRNAAVAVELVLAARLLEPRFGAVQDLLRVRHTLFLPVFQHPPDGSALDVAECVVVMLHVIAGLCRAARRFFRRTVARFDAFERGQPLLVPAL